MIKSLTVKNFKSHKNTEIHFGALTLLCGSNGVGKSSIIQTFLLLRQTFYHNQLDRILRLNRPLCNLGKTKDIAFSNLSTADEKNISFCISDEKDQYHWEFDVSKDLEFLERLNKANTDPTSELLPFLSNNFQYLSAYRTAESLSDDYEVQMKKQLSIEEGKGELTAHFLYEYGKSIEVDKNLLHPSESDPYLLSQVTAWEREISQNVNIKAKKVGEGYEIKYSFETHLGETDDFSYKNVGFGLSYALPVIVAILASKPGAFLILENPEAHLHPYGQAKIAELICIAAQAGIQIIVETHSDHIINGILVNCKRFELEQQGISKDNVKIYHFVMDKDKSYTIAENIKIEAGGLIRYTPEGFFDQFTNDRKYLMGF